MLCKSACVSFIRMDVSACVSFIRTDVSSPLSCSEVLLFFSYL